MKNSKNKLTIGSFYWQFSGRPALYDAILEDWLATNTRPLEDAVKNAGGDPRHQYLAFFGVWVLERNFNPAYGNAVRMWSRTSPQIASVVAKVKASRIDILRGIYKNFGYASADAEMRARVTYYQQVGYYAMNVKETTTGRVDLAPDYANILRGFDWMRELAGTDKIKRAMSGELVEFEKSLQPI